MFERSIFAGLALLSLVAVAGAGDIATPPPLTSGKAADAVLSAVRANDEASLKALAVRDAPDPWLVADELIRRGEFDAAESFAEAATRPDTESLPAYVRSRRGTSDDPAPRKRLAAANAALRRNRPQDALGALGPDVTPVAVHGVGVRIAGARGSALMASGRPGEAATAFRAAAEAAHELGWLSQAFSAYLSAGMAAIRCSAFDAAMADLQQSLALGDRRGDAAGTARALGLIGVVHSLRGEYEQALAIGGRAWATLEALGDGIGAARELARIGDVYQKLGEHAKAIETIGRALAAMEALGDKVAAPAALSNLGIVHFKIGDFQSALAMFERALTSMEAMGDRAGSATTLGNMGSAYCELGDYEKALDSYQRALAAKDALGDRAGAAGTLGDIGGVYLVLGKYANALSIQERALAEMETLGDRVGAALVLGRIADIHSTLGNYPRALAIRQRVMAAKEAFGDAVGVAKELAGIGEVHHAQREYPMALSIYERAWAALEALGDRVAAAQTLGNIALVHYELGDFTKALAAQERALSAKESLGDRLGAARTLCHIGVVQQACRDSAKALETFERALAASESLGDRKGVVAVLCNIGSVHLSLGDYPKAMAVERRAALLLASLVRGLGAEEGGGARERLSAVFVLGGAGAVAARDAKELAFFLESGRAGALLEGLSAKEALWSAAVPEQLRNEEAKARAAETLATAALRKAVEGGSRAEIKAKRAELDAAQEKVSAVIARIQREAKAGAQLVYPEAATLAEISGTLKDGEALVLFGLLDEESCALVVTKEAARIVSLGKTAKIEEAVKALSLEDPEADASAPLTALAALVVKPLDLPESVKQVLVSPSGALSYVPFAALMPSVTVSYVPSGTAYRLLLEEAGRKGEGVLALGDPDYQTKVDETAVAVNRGSLGRLTPLPATRDEAKAVGTVVLLGAEATESGLRAALAKNQRWRAVHLACHGLVDSERPVRSSLAVTAGGGDDGFLTCLEVFRTRFPADLVVLSACETAKGKVVASEGIVGLTRGFMFAGAPRVICSLWKVDDEATSALMKKFYELWNPKDGSAGLPTAEALKVAQAHVRSQEKWAHPYYWAAWVLWGLAE